MRSKPNKIFVSAVLAVVVLAGSDSSAFGAEISSPFRENSAKSSRETKGLICEQNTHDFGSITLREALSCEHNFVLKNTSDHLIRVIKQTSTCGCTVAEVSEELISPGGLVKVLVKADWAGRAGRQVASVILFTDDPKTPPIKLSIAGFVKVPAILKPAAVDFGPLKPGQQVVRVVELGTGSDPRPFRITAIENPSRNIQVSRLTEGSDTKPIPPLEGGPGKFTVKIIGPRNSGRESTRIIFRTDLDEQPEVPLQVKAKFQGVLMAAPQSILFSDAADQDMSFQEVQIRSSEDSEDLESSAKLLWKGRGTNPFFIKDIIRSGQSEPEVAVITVGLNRKELDQRLTCAVLQVTVGADSIDVTLVAISRIKD